MNLKNKFKLYSGHHRFDYLFLEGNAFKKYCHSIEHPSKLSNHSKMLFF